MSKKSSETNSEEEPRNLDDGETEGPSSGNIPMSPELARAVMQALLKEQKQRDSTTQKKKEPKENYAFWGSQPVTQFDDQEAEEDGPIDEIKTVESVRKQPLNLPNEFEWCTCDVQDDEVAEEVYKLLKLNYVEDDDMMFRFDYSPAFLKWALLPPGFKVEWLVGVRVTSSKKLVGFISAIPAEIQINNKLHDIVEVNFLCVHKKLRSRRLAPVLIKEITRRVNLYDIWQACYTAGVLLPTPIAKTRYWHRSLNPKKLIDVKFSRLAENMTIARTVKLFRLPNATSTKGLRELTLDDCPKLKDLLQRYLSNFQISPRFDLEAVKHWFLPRPGVIYSYVVESAQGEITDLISFYALPSSVLKHPVHTTLHAAYMHYTVPGETPILDLMKDTLILAKQNGFDVFNALDILENERFLKELKFGEGDGYLQYYLFNWRVTAKLLPNQVGLILL